MSNSFKNPPLSMVSTIAFGIKTDKPWEAISDDEIKQVCNLMEATMSFQDFVNAYQERKTLRDKELLWDHMTGADCGETADFTPSDEELDNKRIQEAQKEVIDFSASEDPNLLDLDDTRTNENTGEFPLYVFPKAYQSYINHISNIFCVLPGTPATALFPVICALSGKASIRVNNELKSYGNIFSVIVGNPGTGKTPLMSTVTSLLYPFMNVLQEKNEKANDEYKKEMARYKRQNKKKQESEETDIVEPKEPAFQSVYCANATMESRFQLLKDSPSLLQFSDELTSFVMGLNQYKQKGSDTEELLSLWNSSHIVLNRNDKSKNLVVWHPRMSMLAAVSPKRLKLFNQYISAETGLFDRFIFDFMISIPGKEKSLIVTTTPEIDAAISEVKKDLARIFETYYIGNLNGNKDVVVSCNNESLNLLDEANKRWCRDAYKYSFMSKGLAHCLNFANVLCVIWQQKELTATMTKFAISLTDYYLNNMKKAYFYATGKGEEMSNARKIKRYALKKSLKAITVREITKSICLCPTVKEAQAILEVLVTLQCGDWKELKTKREVVLNPSWLNTPESDE